MTTRLVLIHGRAQQHKDAATLKAEWVTAWEEGLHKNGLGLPLAADEIRFPYYGDTLWDLVSGQDEGDVADVIVRGEGAQTDEQAFIEALVAEIKEQTGLTDEQVREALGAEVITRGPLNWEWTQAVLRAVDRFVPGASGASVALFTRDVYRYLTNPGIRDRIESGVLQAMEPGVPTVVVAHSLGSVVAYSLLRREGASRGWNVPLFITVGAPLGVRVIKKRLSPIGHPECAQAWFNALDQRDVVALYPLTESTFPVDPAIENKTDVENDTPNRHGIVGYLSDQEVARRIADALR